jgi:hypothetical protein
MLFRTHFSRENYEYEEKPKNMLFSYFEASTRRKMFMVDGEK